MSLFISGIIIGTFAGIVIAGLLAAAKKGNELMDSLQRDCNI